MRVIYLVGRRLKYHTDQSHRIHYFFTSPLAVQWVTMQLDSRPTLTADSLRELVPE